MFSIGCFIQGSVLLTYAIHSFVKHEAWIAFIIGYMISLPILWMYISLAKRFPGKSLIEINQAVLGKILGRIFSVLYIFFFLTLAFLNTRDVGEFVGGYMLPLTPMPIVLIMFIFICCWAVRKGVQTMTRYGPLFVIILTVVILFTLSLIIKNIKLSNLLPVFSMPLKNYLKGAYTVAMLPVCEIFAFFMLLPHLQDTKAVGKAFWGGAVIGTVTLLIIVITNTMVLGPIISSISIPSFAMTRLINIGDILTRMEILYATNLLMVLFFKTSILIYAAVSGISRLLKFDSHKFLVPTFGVIIIIFALTIFDSSIEHSAWAISGGAPIYSTFFLFFMPAVTIAVAAVRGFFKKKEAEGV